MIPAAGRELHSTIYIRFVLSFVLSLITVAVAQAQTATYRLHRENSSTTNRFQLTTANPDAASLAVQSANLKNLANGEYLIKEFDTQSGVPGASGIITAGSTISVEVWLRKTATTEHPFWVVGAGWTAAGELRRGSALLTKDGIVVHVDTIERREGKFKVYNFEVQGSHTYYASELGVLVHNICLPPFIKDLVRKPYPTKANRAGIQQPYNPANGQYLPYAANGLTAGMSPSTLLSVVSGTVQGVMQSQIAGAPAPPAANGTQRTAQRLGLYWRESF